MTTVILCAPLFISCSNRQPTNSSSADSSSTEETLSSESNSNTSILESSSSTSSESSSSSIDASSSSSSNDSSSSEVEIKEDEIYAIDNGFVFTKIEGKKEYRLSYNGDKNVKSLSLPEQYNGIPVTIIDNSAFKNLVNLNSIVLPSTVKEIKDEAFYNCRSLSNIYLGNDLLDVVLINQYTYSNIDINFGENVFTNSYLPTIHLDSNNNQGDVYVSTERVTDEFDSFDYHIEMNSESPFKVSGSIELDQVIDNKKVVINVGAHGKYKESYVDIVKGDNKVRVEMPNFGIYASHYNVAFLSATYPTTIFALKAPTITENGTIPTYTFLERNKAFDWDNLQYNIRALPNTTWTNATLGGYSLGVEYMNEFIKDLYDVNPSSKITFYVTDLSVDMVYKFFVANRIHESQYNIVMLSDGTASASLLVKNFSGSNPTSQYQRLYNSLKNVKDHIWTTGEFDIDYISKNLAEYNPSANFPCFHFANHIYTTLNLFSNCQWWVNRFRVGENLAAINQKDPNFANSIVSNPKLVNNIYANSLLAGLNEEQQTKFKALFHFNTDDFDLSRENGKKIIVILGTSWSGESSSLYNYMKATMDFYGDEYDYYYKPHPGWPTSTCTERKVIFDQLKDEGYSFTEIDGAIAAEIIMYFNNDIYLCGYSSSTYASLDSTNKGMGLMEWGVSMPTTETSQDAAYKPYMYNYLTILNPDSELGQSLSLDTSKSYYLVEYNDYNDKGDDVAADRDDPTIESEYSKHDIAVYCLEDGTVTYYKNGIAVNKDGSAI